ncbi:MAG: hypothetical protein Kow0068_01610 [Marinilabiliales bacterium]
MKKLIIILLLVYTNVNLYCDPIDSLLANTIAKNYFEYLNPNKNNIEIKNTITIFYNRYPSYYIINFIGGGYIAISANDATTPVLMYSYDGEYIENDFHNPAFLLWMENYSKEIDSLRINNVINNLALIEWENILNKNFNQNKGTIIVQPLLTSRWGQTWNNDGGYPGYNYLCPASDGCDDDRCDAGCGPVAMAQVMRFWMHPVHSTYQDYDWCNMPDALDNSSSMEQIEAVAELIHDCGVAAGVNYCVAEWAGGCATSLWPLSNAKDALITLGYSDDADVDRRAYYSKSKWISKIKNDLNKHYPVIYTAWENLNFTKGHIFIIDGYNGDDKFHINWGWHGNSQNNNNDDGWFEIGDLTPVLGATTHNFNTKQRAIFNLHPEWHIDCDSIIQVLQSYQYTTPLLYFYPVAGTVLAGEASTPMIIQNGQTVTYQAYKNVILKEGFTTMEGSTFLAKIIQCPAECPLVTQTKIMEVENTNSYFDYDTLYFKKSTDFKNELEFQLYPNPNNGSFKILINNCNNEPLYIFVSNILGKPVYNNRDMLGDSFTINITDEPPGIYYIYISCGDVIAKEKIVVQ